MEKVNVKIYGKSSIGNNTFLGDGVIIGYPTATTLKEAAASGLEIEDMDLKGAVIGDNAIIRSNTIILSNVNPGNNLLTGHNVLIREETTIGDDEVLAVTDVLRSGAISQGQKVKDFEAFAKYTGMWFVYHL